MHFDQVLVVSLEQHTDRYARVAQMLDGLGVTNHRRWPAFDAAKTDNHKQMQLKIGTRMTGTGSGWFVCVCVSEREREREIFSNTKQI